ncbi:MAG: hypothetical protein WBG48_13550 [Pricia sp.]
MTGIIVLCRFNSSRLPGKILREINGKQILTFIMERLDILSQKYPIVVCTSIEETDNPIVKYCQMNSIKYFRGNLNNVAQRFLECAKQNNFDYGVRINGDNIFLDAHLIEGMIKKIELNDLDFISNVKDRTYPKGMSVEIVKTSFYEKAFALFEKSDLEHVMTYFYRMEGGQKFFVYNSEKSGQGLNFAIDTSEDFDNAQKIISAMKNDHTTYNYQEIIHLHNKIQNHE